MQMQAKIDSILYDYGRKPGTWIWNRVMYFGTGFRYPVPATNC